jgi:hypothetical protein
MPSARQFSCFRKHIIINQLFRKYKSARLPVLNKRIQGDEAGERDWEAMRIEREGERERGRVRKKMSNCLVLK